MEGNTILILLHLFSLIAIMVSSRGIKKNDGKREPKTLEKESESCAKGCERGNCTLKENCSWYDSLSFEATGSCADAKPGLWVCCMKKSIFYIRSELSTPRTFSSVKPQPNDKNDDFLTSRGYEETGRRPPLKPTKGYERDFNWNEVRRDDRIFADSRIDGCGRGQCTKSKDCRGRNTKAAPATGECSRRSGDDWICCSMKVNVNTESYSTNHDETWKKSTRMPNTVKPIRKTTSKKPKTDTTSPGRQLPNGCGLRSGVSRRRTRSLHSLTPEVDLFETNNMKINSIDRSIYGRVVGGREADPFSWPWMAAIFKKKARFVNRFVSAGTLISPKFILSAAHVITEEDIRAGFKYSVRLGTHTGSENLGEYRVKSVRVHPLYNPRYYYHDLALLELEEPVQYNNYVSPVCLPDSHYCLDSELVGLNTIVTGWGDEAFGGKSSDVMKEATVTIVSRSSCNSSYVRVASAKFPRGITDKLLCAGDPEGNNDACQGDSGGPLLLSVNNHHWIQIGIVSFGHRCGDPHFPGVYTKVAHYADWIYGIINRS